MKKAAVVGLYSIKNAGDVILCQTTAHLLRTVCPDTEIVPVDVNPVNLKFKGRWSQLKKLRDTFFRGLQKLDRDLFSYGNSSRFRYVCEYAMWYLQNHRRFVRQLRGADAVVFAGGGFLKFRTQGLNYHVEQIIKIAEKYNIPVMMNGVGIEGYDEHDIRCQRLKRAINRGVVKVITTRDDIRILQDRYMENPDIVTAQVGDPALWSPECYADRIAAAAPHDGGGDENGGPFIGLNVIRGNVYRDYGNSLSEYELLNFYKHLVHAIEARGMRWRLFSNGMKADNVFGRKLLRALGRTEKGLLVSPATPAAFIDHLREYDCVVGARLHACIVAYAMDVPVVGFIWNDKTRFFAAYTGRSPYYFDENHLDVETIADALTASMAEPYDDTVREELRQKTVRYLAPFAQAYLSDGHGRSKETT